MKKNIFSRAMAVLASVAVLSAVSMMSASAAGVTGGSVEAKPGSTVDVPFTLDIAGCAGAELTFTASAPLAVVSVSDPDPMASAEVDGGLACVFVDGTSNFTGATVTVSVAADAAPGAYPVNVAITEGADGIDDGDSGYVKDPVMVAGTVMIPDADGNVPTTTATEAAATTAEKTTVKDDEASTGSAGVAVAVSVTAAIIVIAGIAVVVIKKKH